MSRHTWHPRQRTLSPLTVSSFAATSFVIPRGRCLRPDATSVFHSVDPRARGRSAWRCLAHVLVAGLGLISALGLEPTAAQAQTIHIEGPLAGAPAVRQLRLYREGRLTLRPHLAFTLQDEYARTIGLGLNVDYHIWDWLGLGVWGMFGAFHPTTNLTDQISSIGQTTDLNALSLPSRERFQEQIGKLQWAAMLQATWIPLRGKLALFQKFFVDTDFYLFGGAGVVGVEERADTQPGTCTSAPTGDGSEAEIACLQSQIRRQSNMKFAPTFGAGLSVYINQWIGVFFEWRALPFAYNAGGTDERGSDGRGNNGGGDFPDGVIDGQDAIFRINHMLNIGATFALPRSAKITE